MIVDAGASWLVVPIDRFPCASEHATWLSHVARDRDLLYLELDNDARGFLAAHEGVVQVGPEDVTDYASLRRFPRAAEPPPRQDRF